MVKSESFLHPESAHRDQGCGIHVAEVLINIAGKQILGSRLPRLWDKYALRERTAEVPRGRARRSSAALSSGGR